MTAWQSLYINAMSSERGRYWCFTLNNPTADEIGLLSTAVDAQEDLLYICWGKEVGESGTPHLQGYLELHSKLRLGGVRKLRGMGRAHVELRKGTQTQAIDYCAKDGEFVEYGQRVESKRGKRNDLESIKRMLDEGATDAAIADEYFGSWCRYRKSFSAYRGVKAAKSSRDVRVVAIFGHAGTGKTRMIFENSDDLFICPSDDLRWFDGYQGEDQILLDDYRGAADVSFLLRFLDRYPVNLPVKGGFEPLRATKIYITSNEEPPFGHTHDVYHAIDRRIHKKLKLTEVVDFDNKELVALMWAELHK